MERYLTVKETARALRVTAGTVRRWLRTGRLHGVKIGHAYRVPESALSTPAAVRPEPGAPALSEWDPEENRRKMEYALKLIDELAPRIRAGTLRSLDVAAEIDAMREERTRDVLGF
jgi:excisionase family DNA binding protein